MAATNTTPPIDSSSAEELTAKAVHKRYEGLVMVRTKAIKGKGAWYWAHLEPLLVHNNDTGLPKAVKLRCSLCEAVFSASNPSRTASEHLKRGTCPNFNSVPKPISSISPSSMASPSSSVQHNHRKRSSSSSGGGGGGVGGAVLLLRTKFHHWRWSIRRDSAHLMLSGGKEDLGALAMLEDSVKKLKSPKTSPGPALSKTQIDSAFDFLADWLYESCGSVSFSSLDHPKFRAFLNQVGLPAISRREFAGPRLDAKFEEAKAESEARIRDAMFFQIASDGWQPKHHGFLGAENLVNLTVNLPNGTSVFRRAVFQCVGVVADKFKAKALKNLENQNHWMVNLSCQYQGFNSLIKDFSKELPLFQKVTENCLKVANFVNNHSQVRNIFQKYQLQEYRHVELLRVPVREHEKLNFEPVYTMLEDILNSARALQLVLLDESYKIVSVEDPIAREFAEMGRDMRFWSELEAVHSLVKLIKEMAQEIETERPLVGQCLPLWNELRAKVKDWCSKFHIDEAPVEKEKDVDKLITRLVSREEAHIALMELMKWRTDGLEPVYAQAVQLKERDPITGKNENCKPSEQQACVGNLPHGVQMGLRQWALKAGMYRAQKMIFIAAHSKLERRDFPMMKIRMQSSWPPQMSYVSILTACADWMEPLEKAWRNNGQKYCWTGDAAIRCVIVNGDGCSMIKEELIEGSKGGLDLKIFALEASFCKRPEVAGTVGWMASQRVEPHHEGSGSLFLGCGRHGERDQGPSIKSSLGNFSFKHSKARDVHAESLGDAPP
ncbi:hypothetical protein CK203_073321 [Vitis vinifera]|uniref:DUF7963 domain-containing protein n=1 Tax=Vitis vinifera TaxID=29760 RepID=A0A438ESR2_VITVI|nr:hypothetical protein CK203_073321 [Vitis vinifera]